MGQVGKERSPHLGGDTKSKSFVYNLHAYTQVALLLLCFFLPWGVVI